MKKGLIFCCIFMICAMSCKKDRNRNTEKTKKDFLTTGNWYIRGLTVNISFPPLIDSSFDAYQVMESCQKDNFLHFEVNGTYIADEGPSICRAEDPQTTTGAWVMTGNDTRLYVQHPLLTDTATILQLNNDTLKLESMIPYNGMKFKGIVTMGR